ncbi:MAG TPA: A24 family peptidase [Phycisphaerae bacterium]|jgi:prepilin peptidase CpaA|nr:prepilin peptidase [Phycisphaerae bacterium]HOB75040.1 A24 family peptidase [Phycisphaerae bacterium]HOJ54825.1 A24 family peptidase [Phycisphaerae bacterium]HOL26897.1 A24 family peptidase [Phycisphaerae bacterium]HPP20852.1 A24 family peptidase [Phycisphaerae bacterium]
MQSAFWTVTCAVMVPGILWASWIDYKERRVPNWLNAAIALAGFAAQAYFNGLSGVGMGALGLAVGFAVLIVPWLMHGMGAGDVKLMMAIGVWLGPWLTFLSFCVGAVVGGVIAVVMILSTGRLWQAYGNLATIVDKCSSTSTLFSEYGSAKSFGSTSQLLPYGVPLTIGTLMIFFGGPLGLL